MKNKDKKVYSHYLSEPLMDQFQMICALSKTKQSNQLEDIIRDYVVKNKITLTNYVTTLYNNMKDE